MKYYIGICGSFKLKALTFVVYIRLKQKQNVAKQHLFKIKEEEV